MGYGGSGGNSKRQLWIELSSANAYCLIKSSLISTLCTVLCFMHFSKLEFSFSIYAWLLTPINRCFLFSVVSSKHLPKRFSWSEQFSLIFYLFIPLCSLSYKDLHLFICDCVFWDNLYHRGIQNFHFISSLWGTLGILRWVQSWSAWIWISQYCHILSCVGVANPREYLTEGLAHGERAINATCCCCCCYCYCNSCH